MDHHKQITLCEVLDRVLNKGVVVRGDITIAVAEVDLIYLSVNILLSSTETLRRELQRYRTAAPVLAPAMEMTEDPE